MSAKQSTKDMNPTPNEQMEFADFPKRNGPAPAENVRELQETLAALLSAQTQQQRVETCHKLIAGAYAVQNFYVVSNPTRIEACETHRVRLGRRVILRRESIIETILTVLTTLTMQRQVV